MQDAHGRCPHCGEAHSEADLVCPRTGAPLPLEGRVLDGKFRLLDKLGEGGMATVWRAENVRIRRQVAIKLMHPEFARSSRTIERFQNEATSAGRIGSAQICDILDFGESRVGPYIVMEMLKGRSLGSIVQRAVRLEYGVAVSLVRQALVGLEAAHRAGIIHRDLKPENLFLHEPEAGRVVVKLMDFGISKFTEDTASGRTGANVLMGTPEYMSPEQTEGAARVDGRADLWAMGVILYRAIAGTEPFMGPTLAATLFAVTNKHPPRLDSLQDVVPPVPMGLANVVERCLAKSPNDRIASARQLSDELAPFEQPSQAGLAHLARALAPGAMLRDSGAIPGGPSGPMNPPMDAAMPASFHAPAGYGAPAAFAPPVRTSAPAPTAPPPATFGGEPPVRARPAQEWQSGAAPSGKPGPTFSSELHPSAQLEAQLASDRWSMGHPTLPETGESERRSAGGGTGAIVGAVLGLILLGGAGAALVFSGVLSPRADEMSTASVVEEETTAAASSSTGASTDTEGSTAGPASSSSSSSSSTTDATSSSTAADAASTSTTGEPASTTDAGTSTGEATSTTAAETSTTTTTTTTAADDDGGGGDDDDGGDGGGSGGGTTPKPQPKVDTSKVYEAGGLYTPRTAGLTTTWSNARRYCSGLVKQKFAGLSKWRLASPSEISKFSGPAKTKYWSSETSGANATTVNLLTNASKIEPQSGKARPFCVSRK